MSKVFKTSNKPEKNDFNEMSYQSKASFLESNDQRLQSFFQTMTEKTDARNASDNTNYLSNAYENLLKARNKNCVPERV